MMKRIALLIYIIFCINQLNAAFKSGNSWSARAAGMGGAFTGIADDASALVYNPAGLGYSKEVQSLFTYFKPFAGVELVDFSYTYFALVFPVAEDTGNMGIGWHNFSADSLYQEYAVLLSYGFTMDKIFNKQFKDISMGINVKYLYHSYVLDKRTVNDPVFFNGRGSGNIGFDIGFLVHDLMGIFPYLDTGIVIKNINEPDIGLLNYDPIYREFRFGVSYKINNVIKNKMNVIPALDIVYRNNEFNLLAGLEALFYRLFVIRAGGNLNEIAGGVGGKFNIMKMFTIQIDYAFLFPLNIKESYGSHQFSLGAKF